MWWHCLVRSAVNLFWFFQKSDTSYVCWYEDDSCGQSFGERITYIWRTYEADCSPDLRDNVVIYRRKITYTLLGIEYTQHTIWIAIFACPVTSYWVTYNGYVCVNVSATWSKFWFAAWCVEACTMLVMPLVATAPLDLFLSTAIFDITNGIPQFRFWGLLHIAYWWPCNFILWSTITFLDISAPIIVSNILFWRRLSSVWAFVGAMAYSCLPLVRQWDCLRGLSSHCKPTLVYCKSSALV